MAAEKTTNRNISQIWHGDVTSPSRPHQQNPKIEIWQYLCNGLTN